MPGKNPPRKTSIRGQRHLLAYITPDEAALLKARGGTGEMHKGIPAYVRGFGGETAEQESRGSGRGGISRGDVDRGNRDARDRQRNRDESDRGARDPVNNASAIAKVKQQIEQGKKGIEQMTGLDKFIAGLVPGAGINVAQNVAAQFMGNRMKDVLSQVGSRAVIDPKTGRVVGAYNASGQLTGRDPAKDRAREAAAARESGAGERAPLFFGAGLGGEEEQPKKAKEVIRTDLAIETEAERVKRRKAGVAQLANRSLLANVSRLGA